MEQLRDGRELQKKLLGLLLVYTPINGLETSTHFCYMNLIRRL